MQAKKSLGQNFLNEDTIIKKIVSLLNVSKKDLVIEIGPGRGALTKYLKNLKCDVICIEIDNDMKSFLSSYEGDNLHVIYDDILNVDLESLTSGYDNLHVIGNLPYYITSPIIEHLIKTPVTISEMIFMVQDEVAKRFSALPGSKDYGFMTSFISDFYNVKYEFYVDKKFFIPMPKVNSAVVKLEKNNSERMDEKYYTFLKNCFALKRKTLKNNLKNYNWNVILEILIKNGYNDSVRAEQIDNKTFKEIYRGLHL